MNKLKELWKSIFGISASEYAGFKWLVITAIFCVSALTIADYATYSPYTNYESDAKMLDSLLAVMDLKKLDLTPSKEPISLIDFDPNTVSKQELLKLGFPEWLASRLLKYRSTGARFSKPVDLKKLYGFPDVLYAQLEGYVKIKVVAKNAKPIENKYAKKTKNTPIEEFRYPVFDINKADTSILQTIRGIGSAFSTRIIKYRNSLGGFISQNQLYEVYNLDSLVVGALIKASLISAEFEPNKIEINKVTKEQLASHPYVNWKKAKLIIAYRNQHGDFETPQNLLKVYSVDEIWLKKIDSYLSF